METGVTPGERNPHRWMAGTLKALRVFGLLLSIVLGFLVRTFSVIKYESMIHEFDPHFNYRATEYLVENGFYEWWNWFDTKVWYPLGRNVGQTLYPGLMLTAYGFYKVTEFLNLDIELKHVCVFVGPIFSGLACLAVYGLTMECSGTESAAMTASFLLALAPSFASRSVAGNFDNESVAIFALIFAFYTYIRALNKTSMRNTLLASVAYLYMVSSWGGYVIVINLISIHTFLQLIMEKDTPSLYVTYSIYYCVGTLVTLSIPFTGGAATNSSEHLLSHLVFMLIQAIYGWKILIRNFSTLKNDKTKKRLKYISNGIIYAILLLFSWICLSGRTSWSGRAMALINPTHSKRSNPLVTSVSEHQPTTASHFLFDLQLNIIFLAAGVWIMFTKGSPGSLFLALYGVFSSYISSVMCRLTLVLCPAAAALSGIGISTILENVSPSYEKTRSLLERKESPRKLGRDESKAQKTKPLLYANSSLGLPLLIYISVVLLMVQYVLFCIEIDSTYISNPTLITDLQFTDGTKLRCDNQRAAFYWLRENTHENAKIMAWWDYGYQIGMLANRTTFVDNNTWNNTHIATVGYLMAASEEKAHQLALKMDVDYVFIWYGGEVELPGDDLNKFYWMVTIAADSFPQLDASAYFSGNQGSSGVDSEGPMKNSLMYRLSYAGLQGKIDRSRRVLVPQIPPLKYFQEVYTSGLGEIRIFKVRRRDPFTHFDPLSGIEL